MSTTNRSSTDPYLDCDGRSWAVEKLDTLLADAGVKATVLAGVSIGLRANGTWSPGQVLAWASYRYRRTEPAALLLLLVTRYFDTQGAHYLGRRECR